MKIKQAIARILCKLRFHTPRVWGHCIAENGKTEYYYNCAFCDDGFWDYAVKLKRGVNMKGYTPLETDKL